MTPKEFTAAMVKLRLDIEEAAAIGVREAAELIKEEAKDWIGKDHDEWPPLAEKTDKEKAAAGFETPDPLLRTGALRDSIEVHAQGLHAEIGTNHPHAADLEHGTSTIPPRPFLSTALRSKGNEAVGVIKHTISRAIHKTR